MTTILLTDCQKKEKREVRPPLLFMRLYKELTPLLLFSSIFTLCLFYFFHNFPISPDEAYYWVWSKNLAANYFDHGPGIAYWIHFSTWIFSDTKSALLAAALAGLFLLINITYLLARECGFSWKLALLATVSIVATPGYFIGSSLVTPDTGMISLGTCALFFFVKYVNNEKNTYLLLTFFFSGLALLFKLSILSFGIAIFFWLLLFRPHIFKKRVFYVGIFLATIIVSPLIFGNLEFHRAKLHHYSNLFSDQKIFLAEMLIGQILALSFPWFFLITSLMGKQGLQFLRENRLSIRLNSISKTLENLRQYSSEEKVIVFLWANFIVLQALASILSLSRNIQINWLFPSYVSILLLSIYYIFHRPVRLKLAKSSSPKTKTGHPKTLGLSRFVYYLGFPVCILSNIFILYGQDLALAAGWKGIPAHLFVANRNQGFTEIVNEYQKYRENLPTKEWTLAAPRYQDAAITTWHLPRQPQVHSLQMYREDQYHYMKLEKIKSKIFIIALAASHIEDHVFQHVETKLDSLCQRWQPTQTYRVFNSARAPIRSGRFYYCYLNNED